MIEQQSTTIVVLFDFCLVACSCLCLGTFLRVIFWLSLDDFQLLFLRCAPIGSLMNHSSFPGMLNQFEWDQEDHVVEPADMAEAAIWPINPAPRVRSFPAKECISQRQRSDGFHF